jgi:hypothetical protein
MFLSSNGIISHADYSFLSGLESEDDKKKWCYFMKNAREYYTCSDKIDETFFSNWVWTTQDGNTEIEKLIYHDYPDGPALTPYIRFNLDTLTLEQFIVLDFGSGAPFPLTRKFGTVPIGRAFRGGFSGELVIDPEDPESEVVELITKVNILSRSLYGTNSLEIFKPRFSARAYYREHEIESRLQSLHDILIDRVSSVETDCQDCENPCQLPTSISWTKWKKLSETLGFDDFEFRSVVVYLGETRSREGYVCSLDVSEDLDIGKLHVDKMLDFLYGNGLVDRKNSCRVSENGTPYPCTVYRLRDNLEEMVVSLIPSVP